MDYFIVGVHIFLLVAQNTIYILNYIWNLQIDDKMSFRSAFDLIYIFTAMVDILVCVIICNILYLAGQVKLVESSDKIEVIAFDMGSSERDSVNNNSSVERCAAVSEEAASSFSYEDPDEKSLRRSELESQIDGVEEVYK